MATLSHTGDAAVAERADATTRILADGAIAGLAGALAAALWFFALDLLQGRPFYTPTVLGLAAFRGSAGLEYPAAIAPSFEMILWFTWLHGLVFVLLGVGAAKLVDIAERRPDLGFGILLLFVVFEYGFLAVCMMAAEPVLRAVAWPAVMTGNLLAAAAMVGVLWRRHPRLRIEP